MVPGLASRLSARFVFVVGKGGVGKSTTAGALALAFADEGERTRLLSTDPAHSVGDLFGRPDRAAEEWTSSCHRLLSLEELDATARARDWLAEMRVAVEELVERGTYLDREDVAALLDGSLPGMDEVMAALRIAALAAGGEDDRVVVDTAPTGHTLRLLAVGNVLDGWTAAIEAMAAKSAAVAFGLTGRSMRFAGELTMQRMRADVDRFVGLLAESDFVVVTREGTVVEAETRRLIDRLRSDGLRAAARVEIGRVADARVAEAIPVFHAPPRDDLIGCEGLRKWGDAQEPRQPGDVQERRQPDDAAEAKQSGRADPRAGRLSGAADDESMPTLLPPRPMMLFAGKGGVGKSTCAAAYAVALTPERRVLLLSTDPAGSLGDVLGRPVGRDGTSFGPGLFARQLSAAEDFERFRNEHRDKIREAFERLGLQHSVALDRRVLESLVDIAPPGLDEVFAVDAILDGPGDRDVLLIDTAPTGHFLRLLEMPEIALSWTRALMRILVKYRAVLGLDDFAQDVLRFARRLKGLIALLADPEESGVVIVTLSDALVRRETERLVATLHGRGVPVSAVIQNLWSANHAAADLDRTNPYRTDSDGAVRVGTGPGGAGSESARAEGAVRAIIRSPRVSPPPVGPAALLGLANQWRAA